ncbi:type IV pilus assembly protein PilM [Candidatus Saccharibacteria bacterium]|nr:type IV pilus assembly protein PilM [Candidatus Saccharibacteria bacterium]
MSMISGVSDFFGLDIGTTAIRVVQLTGGGPVKSLARYAFGPIDTKLALSDSKADLQKLAESVKNVLSQSGIGSKNVAVGIPSQRVFTTVIDIDRLSPSELAQSIKFEADSVIPTPIEESKIDWALLGDSPKDQTKVEVLLSSVPNDFIEARLDMLETIGLNVVAFEPDNLALSRSLVAPDATAPQLIVDIGKMSTDLVVVMNGAPRVTRSIPTGSEAIIKAAMQNLNIDQNQAEQFVFKFGLVKDKLESQVYQAIIGTIELLITDIEKSIKFFENRYVSSNAKISNIIVTGGASALPEFPLFVANRLGVNVEIGNAWRNVSYGQDKQNDLLAISNHFGVAAGLAERTQ